MASQFYIGWSDANSKTNTLLFELCVSRTHDGTAVATKHKVEKGSDISDHVRPENRKLSVELMVSDAPLEALNDITFSRESRELHDPYHALRNAGSSTLTTTGPEEVPGAIASVFAQLDALRLAGQIVEVFTPEFYFTGMCITKLTIKRDKGNGGAATLSLSFDQLRFVETRIVNAPIPTEPRGEKKKPQGKKDPTDDGKTGQRKDSMLDQGLGILKAHGFDVFGG